jgi:hypothetical protein
MGLGNQAYGLFKGGKDMLEKVLTYGMGAFGIIFGFHLADATSKPTDPKVITLGKEVTAGGMFGLAGYKAGTELYSLIPKKGDAK